MFFSYLELLFHFNVIFFMVPSNNKRNLPANNQNLERDSLNGFIVNPEKFRAFVLDKLKSNNIDVNLLWVQSRGNLSCIISLHTRHTIDDKLKFNLRVDNFCLKSANQLNSLVRIKRFLRNEERKVLINSFILSNFNYCPLVWALGNAKSVLEEKSLSFLC